MKSVKLSYSSMRTLLSCENRYHHYKIANTPHDSDYQEGDALGFGKAFHEVLERTMHLDFNEALILEAMTNHSVAAEDRALLEVMLRKYIEYHRLSGLKIVKCELPIETSIYVGFLDAIAIDKNRRWWIVDLKTAGRHDENILPQLAKDMQLNLYSKFAEDIHLAVPEIKDLEFGGCRYRQVIKSKAQTLKGLESGVKVIDIEVPATVLNPQEAWSTFLDAHTRAVELANGESPRKNYAACFNYFSPCPYFSQCHGEIFSSNKSKVIVHTLETIQSGDLL